MAYDGVLAARMREMLKDISDLQEKKMFGGVGFLIGGNMACGVNANDLIVRVGPERHQAALAQPHTRVFDFSGKPMSGWVVVDPAGGMSEDELRQWLLQGVDFARSLPPK